MPRLTPQQLDHARSVACALEGLVQDLSAGRLSFREPEPGELALTGEQRRQIGRYYARGLNDDQVAEVLASW